MSLIVSLLIVLIIAGVAFAILRAVVRGFGLPAVIETVGGLVIGAAVVIYLLKVLLAVSGTSIEGID